MLCSTHTHTYTSIHAYYIYKNTWSLEWLTDTFVITGCYESVYLHNFEKETCYKLYKAILSQINLKRNVKLYHMAHHVRTLDFEYIF